MLPVVGVKCQSVILDLRAGRVFRLRKSVMTAARLVNDRLIDPAQNPHGWRFGPLMITFTYRDDVEWKPEHLSKSIEAMQIWAKRKGGFSLPYVWVMELTKRGRPHFHLIVWMPLRWRLPKPDKRGWWKYGSTRVDRVKNAVGYVAKYASKFESKDAEFPSGARIHGTGGMTQHEKRVLAWWKLPKDLRRGSEGSCVWRRAPGGGWYDIDTHERIYPQWQIASFSPGGGYVRLLNLPPEPDDVHFKEHYGYRSQVLRNVTKKDERRALSESRKIQAQDQAYELDGMHFHRVYLDRVARLERWRSELERDRAAWQVSVEKEYGLGLDDGPIRSKLHLASLQAENQRVLRRLSRLRAAWDAL